MQSSLVQSSVLCRTAACALANVLSAINRVFRGVFESCLKDSGRRQTEGQCVFEPSSSEIRQTSRQLPCRFISLSSSQQTELKNVYNLLLQRLTAEMEGANEHQGDVRRDALAPGVHVHNISPAAAAMQLVLRESDSNAISAV